jgi:hypothetical protein
MLKQITTATYILIMLNFLRLAVNKLQAGNIHGAIKVDREKYPFFMMFPYRIGNTLRAIVTYYRDSCGYGFIFSAARLAFPSMFYGMPLCCTSTLIPEELFKFSTNPLVPSGIEVYNFYIDEYLTAAETKNILESIKHKSGIDTVTGDIILVPFYQPSEPEFHIPPAGTELHQMSATASSIRYAEYVPKSDSEMLSADGLVHYH